MGFGSLLVTVVFAAYVLGTLAALVALGDLSDHIGRKKVLAIAVACAANSRILCRVRSDADPQCLLGIPGRLRVALSALILIPETVRNPDGVVSVRPRLRVPHT
jgi:MFS family permease